MACSLVSNAYPELTETFECEDISEKTTLIFNRYQPTAYSDFRLQTDQLFRTDYTYMVISEELFFSQANNFRSQLSIQIDFSIDRPGISDI